MTKTEMRSWMKRVREDLREAERLLRTYAHIEDCQAELYDLFADASGSAAELQNATAAVNPYHQYEDEG